MLTTVGKEIGNAMNAAPATITEAFSNCVAMNADRPALKHKLNGAWQAVSWRTYASNVELFSRALIALGVGKGDKVAIIGSNSPEWFFADMAVMTMGAVIVPIYATSSDEQITYILNHSESKVLVTDDVSYLRRLEPLLPGTPCLTRVVVTKGEAPKGSPVLLGAREFETASGAVDADELTRRREGVGPDDVATLIYTSGTTGHPKAVLLTHRNCVTAARNIAMSTRVRGEYTSCSYLPLAHVGDRDYNLLSRLLDGGTVYFLESYEKFVENLREIRPTMWAGVPRVWEKLYEGIMHRRNALPEKTRRWTDWALRTGREHNWRLYKRQRVGLLLAAKYRVARALVLDKLLAAIGLDRVQEAITGGAPTPEHVLDFYVSLGVFLQDVYGQTEDHGTTSFATREAIRFGSVGKPYPLTEVRIASDGEILVRGDNVSPGYYKDPQLTAETLRGGWLHSGDHGYLDEDGFLWINGRKKDILITSGGKNITPVKIEDMLQELPIVEYAVVAGDGRKYLTALLMMNGERLARFAGRNGGALSESGDLLNDRRVVAAVDEHVEKVNRALSRAEQIKKYKILLAEASVASGELTPTMKVRRHSLLMKYVREVEEMY